MKRIFIQSCAVAIVLALAPSATFAQNKLGNALEQIFSGSAHSDSSETTTTTSTTGESKLKSLFGSGSDSQSGTGSDLVQGLVSIFSNSKVATADKIVGTWVYEEPAVVFESSNALKNIGGSVASKTIEKKAQSYLEKYGIKKGTMKMTFDKNGNFTQTIGKKTLKGTYSIDKKNVKLSYGGRISQTIGTTQLDGNSLLIVMDASKFLKYAGALGKVSGVSTLKTVGSLLSGMDGMQVGVRMKK